MQLQIGQYRNLLDLSKSNYLISGAYEQFVNQAVLTISNELNVSRVSFWLYDDENELIKNELLYDSNSDRFSSQEVLEKKDYPNYFNAFQNELCIIANDATQDERTREFKAGYLDRHSIKSMMDVQVSVQGGLFGVICLEQTCRKRVWKKDEELFVSAIASYISQSYITKLKNDEESKRKESEVNYEMLFLDSPIPMWVYHPRTHRFLEVNNAAIDNYGYTKEEFLEMNIFNIKPDNEIALPKESLSTPIKSEWQNNDRRHVLKNGMVIDVKISSSWTVYQGDKARIVMSRNITDEKKLRREKELSLKKFEDCAFYASHNLRGPVARLLGLNFLLEDERSKNALSENTLDVIHTTVLEIDEMIKVLNKKLEG